MLLPRCVSEENSKYYSYIDGHSKALHWTRTVFALVIGYLPGLY